MKRLISLLLLLSLCLTVAACGDISLPGFLKTGKPETAEEQDSDSGPISPFDDLLNENSMDSDAQPGISPQPKPSEEQPPDDATEASSAQQQQASDSAAPQSPSPSPEPNDADQQTPSPTPKPNAADQQTPSPSPKPNDADQQTPSPSPKPPVNNAAEPKLPAVFSSLPQFWFGSGVGGWGTTVEIYADGTFYGFFHDSDMGDDGPGYPYGTRYECGFSGKFTDIYAISDYEYSMRIEYLNIEDAIERIEDGVRIIPSGPYGFDDAYEFRLYLPGRNTYDLPEQFIWWVASPMAWSDVPDVLPFYGLYNIGGEAGFFG
ncbi:MAG: hypothetical protein FWH33_04345 [Oscillospiraceae bacterium]|nr:hypothetical protein [Oscillospiraceae bacterium]